MGRIVVTEFISLDGVSEDPGGAEDYKHGGWSFEFNRGEDGDKFKFDELMEAEVPLSTVSMDVRPGGRFEATMFYGPTRFEINWKGEYLEVVEPERLVFTISDRPTDDYELVTVVLTNLGDGRTEMLLEQRGGMSPDEYKRARDGWSGFLDVIEERLSG